jgi:hypothetical protein
MTRKRSLLSVVLVVMLALVLALALSVPTLAEGLPTVSSPAPAGPPSGSQPPAVQATVLWDQPVSLVNQNGYVNQDFPEYPIASSFLADDFVNSVPWSIESIFIPGNGWNDFTTLMNATALTWEIYADDAGQPAGDPKVEATRRSGALRWLPPTRR